MSAAPPRTDWREDIAPDENARFEKHAQTLHALQADGGRALHRKAHLGGHGSFEILADLPAEVRAGVAARPATYRAYVRFSNGASRSRGDSRPDVRGLAVKVLGVEGKKLIPGLENATTQDFLAILQPSTPFRHVDEFVATVYAGRNPSLALPRILLALGPVRALGVIQKFVAGAGVKTPSLARQKFFSALPVRWGDHAAKYAFLPAGADPVPGGAPTDVQRARDRYRRDLAYRLARAPIVYDFAVQLYRDPVHTPIEDASVEWLERDAPFQRVGRLTIPRQDVNDTRGQMLAERIEKLSFDPWHALVEHRPLGNMMRARKNAYRVSTQARHAAAEPDGSEWTD